MVPVSAAQIHHQQIFFEALGPREQLGLAC